MDSTLRRTRTRILELAWILDVGCGQDADEGGDQLALDGARNDGVGHLRGGIVVLLEAVKHILFFKQV